MQFTIRRGDDLLRILDDFTEPQFKEKEVHVNLIYENKCKDDSHDGKQSLLVYISSYSSAILFHRFLEIKYYEDEIDNTKTMYLHSNDTVQEFSPYMKDQI